MKDLRTRLIVIGAVLALSIWAFYPPQQKVNLGLDLKGGVHLVLRVQTDDALRAWTNALAIAHDEVEREGVYLHFARHKLHAERFEFLVRFIHPFELTDQLLNGLVFFDGFLPNCT